MSELKAAVLPVTAFQQNCTLLWDEPSKQGAVVDPGGDVVDILNAIAKVDIRPACILLTHGHMDHAGGAAALKDALEEQTGGPVPILGPDERDEFLLAGLEAQAAAFGMTETRNVRPNRWLGEGETVSFAGHRFEVLHCPGHTPGHIVFINRTVRFGLVGDVLFQGSIGRTDFPYGDADALLRSIRDKLLPLGDDFAFICGHGPGSTIGVERRSNPFLKSIASGSSPDRGVST